MTLDRDALRAKYRAERAKRLRPDGNAQYRRIAGAFAHYAEDPYTPRRERAPKAGQVAFAFIGGGFAGLATAARLKEAGIEDAWIIEKGGDFGGTWYWNRYPGAACDTESYIYLPLLEETGYMPARKYAPAAEIRAHAQRMARHFDLYRHALLQTQVSALRWDEASQRWQVRTDRADELGARFVVLAGGLLNRPKLPGIPGLESFQGHCFHTSRWDYAYTGGDGNGGLTGLADQRVGLIGTGATAVQCVPHLAAGAASLHVFQRTPSAVDVRDDRPTDPQWAASLQPGWQRERMMNFTAVVSGGAFDVDLVNDGWTDLIGNVLLAGRRSGVVLSAEQTQALIQQADDHKMERIRARVDAIVRDPATAAALKPWYGLFCKRPCFHDGYLPAFNRPNVHLVDTAGQGVERILPHGVRAGGREIELDCLIFGTGFEVGTDYTRRLGFEVEGRGARTLSAQWREGARTLHGLLTHGFPNLFIVSMHQTGQSPNFQHMLDEQARHIAWLLATARERGIGTLEASEQAQDEWTAEVVKYARIRNRYLADCTPGYYNNEGHLDARTERNAAYWRGPTAFIRLLDAWRRDGRLDGLEAAPRREAAIPSR